MELGEDGDHINLLSNTVGRIRSIGMVHDMVHRHENIAELELEQYTFNFTMLLPVITERMQKQP